MPADLRGEIAELRGVVSKLKDEVAILGQISSEIPQELDVIGTALNKIAGNTWALANPELKSKGKDAEAHK